MKIEKTFTVAAPQQQVWEFITSPEQVAPCIPGCEGAEQTGPGTYKATIHTKVGPIKATFHVDIETKEERPPEFAAYVSKGEEGSRASRLNATSTLALKALDADHTEVTYASEIKLMGRLGKFGAGIMNKVADSIGDQFVAELRKRVEGETPETPLPTATSAAGRSARPLLIAGAVISALMLVALWLMRG
jgi:carbon monoxide dehydrogenase subunit G